jgi:hypothetical protein
MKKALFFLFTSFTLFSDQVLHSVNHNKPYQETPDSLEFYRSHLVNAVPLDSDAEVLRYASDHANKDGVFIELGVWKARTVNFIAALNPHKTIYGFDSFEGLPTDWDKGDRVFSKGLFSWPQGQPMPLMLLNVELIKGLFTDTLPVFTQTHLQDTTLSFVHVDCDVYSSTIDALNILGPYMTEGTILVFDELYNYPNYQNHEWKALQEFLTNHAFEAEYLAFNPVHEQVAIRLHQISANGR